MAESIEQLIRRIAAEEQVDPDLAVAMARQESGLNPRAVGDNGDSLGLFQLNQRGMGAGMGDSRYDPETNARVALRSLAQTQQRTGLSGGALAAASQRPADPQGYARSVDSLVRKAPMADTSQKSALMREYESQRTDLQKRIDNQQAQLRKVNDATELWQAYNADRKDPTTGRDKPKTQWTPTDKWLDARGIKQADLDAAKALVADNDPDKLQASLDKDQAALKTLSAKIATETDRAGKETSAPKLQNFGTAAQPQWRQYDAASGQWAPVQGIPAGQGAQTAQGQVVNLGAQGGVWLVDGDGNSRQLIGPKELPDRPQMFSLGQSGGIWLVGQDGQAQQVVAPSEQAGEPELRQAQAESARQTAALNKAKLDLLSLAQQEVQTAMDLPDGPERLKALEAIGQKYAMVADPTAALTYLDNQAARRLQMAESLAKQTGYQFDPATMQRVMDEQGQPKLTEAALQDRIKTAQTAASEATRSAQAMLPYLAPAGTAEDLAALNNAARTGTRPPPMPVRTMTLSPEQDPNQVGQQVFARLMQHLAPGSPLASQMAKGGHTDPSVLNQPMQAPAPQSNQPPLYELLKRYGQPTGPTGTGMALPESVAAGEG